MKCFVLVCNIHRIWRAGGAGRNTGFWVLSCCSQKRRTYIMEKMNGFLYQYIFRTATISERTMFVKDKLSYRHLAAEYGFNILYTNLLWLFRCKLLTWDQNDLSLLTKACWDLLVQISWNQQCISWSFTRYTIIRHKTTSIPSIVVQLRVLYLCYSIAPCATGS